MLLKLTVGVVSFLQVFLNSSQKTCLLAISKYQELLYFFMRGFWFIRFFTAAEVYLERIDHFQLRFGLLEEVLGSIYLSQVLNIDLRHIYSCFGMSLLLIPAIFKATICSHFAFDTTFVYKPVTDERYNRYMNNKYMETYIEDVDNIT